jgi:hypothetical protein
MITRKKRLEPLYGFLEELFGGAYGISKQH